VKASSEQRFASLVKESPVYAVTDDSLPDEQLEGALAALLDAGIRVVQYRDKMRGDRARVAMAARLASMVHQADGLLIINDRVDIAIAAGADGAHLGQDDLPLDVARRLLGPDLLLGASASYMEEIEPDRLTGVDYLGFGAVYATDTKPDAEYAGLDLFRQVCERTNLPVVGIGGISLERVPDVMACGAAGVAVVSALFQAGDPGEAARKLLAAARGAPRVP
jgi:thiamine-phosphate pyrophosphorylase